MATQLGMGGNPKPHSLRGDGQAPERDQHRERGTRQREGICKTSPCGWRDPGCLLPGCPRLCPSSVLGEAHGLCKQNGKNYKQGKMDREGRGKGESTWASVKPSHDPVQTTLSESRSRAAKRAERFPGAGRKGSHPPSLAQEHCGGAEPGPRCLTLGDHGHPESQQRAQTSMLSSLRPCPAPLPLHAMCPGRLSARLSSLLSMALGHRALRAGWEQGVGGEGLGTCTRAANGMARRARLLRRAGGGPPPAPRGLSGSRCGAAGSRLTARFSYRASGRASTWRGGQAGGQRSLPPRADWGSSS